MNIFEYAVKNKMRFNYKGVISVEDLFDLKVEELDSIYKSLNSKVKQEEEDSLLQKKTKSVTDLTVAIEIVKYIVAEKLEEVEARKKQRENKEKKQKLLAILADKQDEELKGKSAEEIQKMIDELD